MTRTGRRSRWTGRHPVRIGIYGIIGFSGFTRRAFSTGIHLTVFGLARILDMGKSASWAKQNPENPPNPDSDEDTPPFPPSTPSFPRKRESRRMQPSPLPETKRRAQPTDPFSLSTPSFPRKRESRRLQPSPLPETKSKQQPTYPFSLHGRRLG